MGEKGSEPSWKNVLRGRPVWISPDPSPEEIAGLEQEFPKVVRFPEEEVRDEVARWEDSAVVARCFGRWVSPDAVLREFRRAGVMGEVEAYGLARGFYIFNLSSAGEREKLLDRPWTVNGQVLAVEEWRRGFLPRDDAITSALLWVRLPHLPAELWGEAALQRLLEEAGEYVMADPFTVERKRLGYARVCIRADLTCPLIPGVRVEGPAGVFWQRFAYENLGSLCLACGSVLHLDGSGCSGTRPASEVVPVAATEGAEMGSRPPPVRRGAWMIAVRRWSSEQDQPSTAGTPSFPGFPSSFPPPTSAGGWQRPTRTSRRGTSSPGSSPAPLPSRGRSKGKAPAPVGGARASPVGQPRNPFAVLGLLGEDGPSGPSPLGPVAPKRARLQAGHVGRALQPEGVGPVRPRKGGQQPAQLKGKGVLLSGDGCPVSPGIGGPEPFQFSAGSARMSDPTVPAPPPAGGPLAVVDQSLLSGGDNDEMMEGLGGGGPVDHEGAVAGMVRAILPMVEAPRGESPPATTVVDAVMSAGDGDDAPTPSTTPL